MRRLPVQLKPHYSFPLRRWPIGEFDAHGVLTHTLVEIVDHSTVGTAYIPVSPAVCLRCVATRQTIEVYGEVGFIRGRVERVPTINDGSEYFDQHENSASFRGQESLEKVSSGNWSVSQETASDSSET